LLLGDSQSRMAIFKTLGQVTHFFVGFLK